jgi:hypothetical protein
MQSPRRDLSSIALPPALIYATALTCGVLAALAVEIYLAGAGFDLASMWREGTFGGARELRTTGPWWAVAGIAFAASWITAAALSRFPPPWHRGRRRRPRAAFGASRSSQRRARGRGPRRASGGKLGGPCHRRRDGLAGSLCRRKALNGRVPGPGTTTRDRAVVQVSPLQL